MSDYLQIWPKLCIWHAGRLKLPYFVFYLWVNGLPFEGRDQGYLFLWDIFHLNTTHLVKQWRDLAFQKLGSNCENCFICKFTCSMLISGRVSLQPSAVTITTFSLSSTINFSGSLWMSLALSLVLSLAPIVDGTYFGVTPSCLTIAKTTTCMLDAELGVWICSS